MSRSANIDEINVKYKHRRYLAVCIRSRISATLSGNREFYCGPTPPRHHHPIVLSSSTADMYPTNREHGLDVCMWPSDSRKWLPRDKLADDWHCMRGRENVTGKKEVSILIYV